MQGFTSDASIKTSQSVRNIEVTFDETRNTGVIFDQTMSMANHLSANFHLRNLVRIRKYITKDACYIPVHSLITSRLDYANATLFGLPVVS